MNKGGYIVTDFLLSKTFSNLTSDELVDKVQASMNKARFRHHQGVSITAGKLAKLNNCDEDRAALAGFIHDYVKQVANEEFIRVIKDKSNGFDQDLLNWNRAIWRGIVGTYFIKRDSGITDSEILTAIRRHTTGDVEMTVLDKTVFIADYIEPGRSFSGIDEAREVTFANSNDGVGYELVHTLQFLANNRQKIYPKTLAAYNVWGIKGEE